MTREEIARRNRGHVDPAPAGGPELGEAMVRLRRRRDSRTQAPPMDWRPLDAPLVCPQSEIDKPRRERRRHRRSFSVETRWFHCLLYPCRAWMVVIGLSCALTVLSAVMVQVLPMLFDLSFSSPSGWAPALLVLPPLLVFGVLVGFLDEVLVGAAAGEYVEVRWPTNNLRLMVRAFGRWLVCLVAGPIVLLSAGVWFWIHCGDPALIDYCILAELVMVAGTYGFLALLSSADQGRLLAVAPPAVGELVLRLGWRLLWVLILPVLLVGCGWLLVAGQEAAESPDLAGQAFLLFLSAWFLVLFFATFLFRLLGLACYHTRPRSTADELAEA
jgi:hypothetical protein